MNWYYKNIFQVVQYSCKLMLEQSNSQTEPYIVKINPSNYRVIGTVFMPSSARKIVNKVC